MQPTDRLYVDQANLDLYWRFIHERHAVWHRRFILRESSPWTTDPVIRDYRFTNVYRELDKGTIYLLDKVVPEIDCTLANVSCLANFHSFEPRDAIFRIMVYRTFNHIDTWEVFTKPVDLITPWNFEKVMAAIGLLQSSGTRVFTNAHIVSPYNSMPGDTKAEKVVHFLDILHQHLDEIAEKIQSQPSLEKVFKYVCSLYGFGPFLAYELVVDFMYRDLIPFTEDDWANAGPGAMRGSQLLFPNRRDYLAVMEELRDRQWEHFDRLHLNFREIAYTGRTKDGHLTLRNIEHCLCEFQKYYRAFSGVGRPRNEFKSTSANDAFWMHRLRG